MIKVLNLYAGLGGNRKFWTDVDVTAVELNPEIASIYENNFSADNIIITDAHEYLLNHHTEFDFIWSSPPCQSHSRMMKATRYDVRKYPDLSLYQEIIWLQHFSKGYWVVENVKPCYEPLIRPSVVIGRHYFWTNFKITQIKIPSFKGFITADSPQNIEAMKKWLGLSYDGNLYYDNNHSPGQVLRNCVHPELGLHILNCALQRETVKEQSLFSGEMFG